MSTFSKEEKMFLMNKFCTTPNEVTEFAACIRMAKLNLPWNDDAGTVSRYRILSFMKRVLQVHTFDETIRWRRCERALRNPTITAIIDHTTTKLRWTLGNAAMVAKHFNLHKGMVYKYLVCCTCQGTPISCSTCQPGRRHDYYLFTSPLSVHYTRDWVIADGGYRGLGGHFSFPIRKPNRRPFTDDQNRSNFKFGRVRSRIERHFGILKRFKILSSTLLNPAQHELFFRFLLLCEHHVRAERNMRGDTPYPCATENIPKGKQCGCDWKKQKQLPRV